MSSGTRFGNVTEIAAFLDILDPEYAQYANALWQEGIRTSRQLSHASKHILLSAGLLELHADDIKASAGGTGEQLACSSFSQHHCSTTSLPMIMAERIIDQQWLTSCLHLHASLPVHFCLDQTFSKDVCIKGFLCKIFRKLCYLRAASG